VIDPNAASDADLWIAYTLILAGDGLAATRV
jgi:endo-1,4-beta-D-glucanase Y